MNTENPLVSISCITFNHAPYIRECLDGFLMQKTNFAIEVLIHDDASTDGTEEIIREYEAKYPDIIKPLYEKENQWVKGRRGSAVFNFPRARGKYIAMCEGDDYWTDPLKLQKQVEFLEKNHDFAGATHACKIEYIGQTRSKIVKYSGNSDIDLGNYLTKNIFITTGSIVFRKKIIEEYPEWASGLFAGDFVLLCLILNHGKIKYLNEVMSVYNKGVPGSWSKEKASQKKYDKEFYDNIFILMNINEMSKYKFSKEILYRCKKLCFKYIARSLKVQKGFNKFEIFARNLINFKINDYKIIIRDFLF